MDGMGGFVAQKTGLEDAQDVLFAHDQIVFTIVVNFLARVLAIQHDVAYLNGHQVAVFARANGDHFAALRLLFSCIGDDDAALRLVFSGRGFDDYTICDWSHITIRFYF